MATCREAEARAIAAEIASLVAAGEKPSEIAILLRSRFSARTYAVALREAGVASRTHGGVGFFDAPEIVDAVAWFRLVVDPSDRVAFVRVLQSAAVGLSDGTVAKLFGMSPDPAILLTSAFPDWLFEDEVSRLERLRATFAIVGRLADLPLTECIRSLIRETAVDAAQATREPAAHPRYIILPIGTSLAHRACQKSGRSCCVFARMRSSSLTTPPSICRSYRFSQIGLCCAPCASRGGSSRTRQTIRIRYSDTI
jgi:hypothetical protein